MEKDVKEFLESLGVDEAEPIQPKNLTDEELAQLRFIELSEDERKAVSKELKERGY